MGGKEKRSEGTQKSVVGFFLSFLRAEVCLLSFFLKQLNQDRGLNDRQDIAILIRRDKQEFELN